MSFQSFEFTTTYVGRGVHALYCWSIEVLCPIGILLHTRTSNGHEGLDERIRIDIIHVYTNPPGFNSNVTHSDIGREMINYLKNACDVVHTPFAPNKRSDELLSECGFKHDTDGIDWVWKKPRKPTITSGQDTDRFLATLLGWKEVALNDVPAGDTGNVSKILCGIPPLSEEMRQVPSYSTDISVSLSLIIELSNKFSLDYQWWKSGDLYSCGVRKGNSSGDYLEEETTPWYESLPLAITHALIIFLSSRHLTKDQSKVRTFSSKSSRQELDNSQAEADLSRNLEESTFTE